VRALVRNVDRLRSWWGDITIRDKMHSSLDYAVHTAVAIGAGGAIAYLTWKAGGF
jgi:hypothetical protein